MAMTNILQKLDEKNAGKCVSFTNYLYIQCQSIYINSLPRHAISDTSACLCCYVDPSVS